jgi:hypothetical protein
VATTESLDELVHAFRTCALPKPTWTHATHLRVGAWHVHHLGEAEALTTLRTGIRRLNESHGVANTESAGYHETITVAYVRIIAVFLAAFEPGVLLEKRVDELVRGPVGHRELPFRFWSRELLLSNRARQAWVEPDLGPLDVTPLLGTPGLTPNP